MGGDVCLSPRSHLLTNANSSVCQAGREQMSGQPRRAGRGEGSPDP